MALHQHLHLGLVVEHGGHLGEDLLRPSAKLRAAALEQHLVAERDEDHALLHVHGHVGVVQVAQAALEAHHQGQRHGVLLGEGVLQAADAQVLFLDLLQRLLQVGGLLLGKRRHLAHVVEQRGVGVVQLRHLVLQVVVLVLDLGHARLQHGLVAPAGIELAVGLGQLLVQRLVAELDGGVLLLGHAGGQQHHHGQRGEEDLRGVHGAGLMDEK